MKTPDTQKALALLDRESRVSEASMPRRSGGAGANVALDTGRCLAKGPGG